MTGGLDGLDVYEVAFMPGEAPEPCLAVVGGSENECRITTMAGNTGWGSVWADGILKDGAGGKKASLQGASVAFPAQFNAETHPSFFIGIDGGAEQGGLYHYELRPNGAEFPV